MAVTGAIVREALASVGAVGNQIKTMDQLAAGADGALRQAPAGLTAAGAASFLATQAQESAYFRTTTEYGSGQSYAPYIGRTFEQVTWDRNYRLFGQWCKAHNLLGDSEAFVRTPASLSEFGWAWLGGVWYFEANDLWPYANRGDHYAVSQGVNRGPGAIGTDKVPNGWSERKAMYDAFLEHGNDLLPATAGGPNSIPALEHGYVGAAIYKLASWFNTNFTLYADTPIPLDANPANQRYGDQTARVIAEFQRRSGITGGDGRNLGPQTRQKLWDAGYQP